MRSCVGFEGLRLVEDLLGLHTIYQPMISENPIDRVVLAETHQQTALSIVETSILVFPLVKEHHRGLDWRKVLYIVHTMTYISLQRI